MAYYTWQKQHNLTPRKGLEGPYEYPNGRVLYYDPKAGEYWDPFTDFFVPHDEVADLQRQIFDKIDNSR